MAVIALLALIVIGPKDLPRAMRSVSHYVRKARGIMREFQSGVDEMIREADLEDARKAIDKGRSFDPKKIITDTIDPTGEIEDEARDIAATARREGQPPRDTAAERDADEQNAAATVAAGGSDDGPEQEPQATVIKHPLKVAPAHSIKPPQAEPADSPGAAETAVGEKSGSSQKSA